MMSESEQLPHPSRTMRDRFWVIGPAGLLLAFFWQPALRLIAPFILTSISSLLVISLVLFERAASTRRRRLAIGLYCVAAILGVTGVGEAIYFTGVALPVSDANDRRCSEIEKHMLAEAAGRAGDAAMFQALGCRPQETMQPTWATGNQETSSLHASLGG